eukprot:scaffold3201_cov116-Isochrysis_galbana.AAC.6
MRFPAPGRPTRRCRPSRRAVLKVAAQRGRTPRARPRRQRTRHLADMMRPNPPKPPAPGCAGLWLSLGWPP